MIKGLPYSCLDSELEALIIKARKLCKSFNDLYPDSIKRDEVLKGLFLESRPTFQFA